MGRFRGRLRKLEREMETTLVVMEHEVSTALRFREENVSPTPSSTSFTGEVSPPAGGALTDDIEMVHSSAATVQGDFATAS